MDLHTHQVTINIHLQCTCNVNINPLITEASDWIGYWGKHMKSEGFKTILPHQKVHKEREGERGREKEEGRKRRVNAVL